MAVPIYIPTNSVGGFLFLHMLYTRKLLELIDEFSKVAGYKINTQQSVTFLYTNNERSERDIKETVPFTITSKRIKHLGINLPQGAKDLSSKN